MTRLRLVSPRAGRLAARCWSATVGLAGLAATTLATGKQTKVLPHVSDDLVFWSAVGVAGAATLTSAGFGVRDFVGTGRAKAQQRVHKALVAFLAQVSEEKAVKLLDLGVSVFVPARRLVWGWLPLRTTLVRVLRYRIDDHPRPSNVRWQGNKGAVGTCWETGTAIHRDWHVQRANYGAEGPTRAEFDALDPELRDGFEYAEYISIGKKYDEVLAVPIVSEQGATVGVVSVDVAGRAGLQTCVLNDSGLEAALDFVTRVIAEDIDRLYSQA